MRPHVAPLVVAALCASPAVASAEQPPDAGFRLHAAVGYPSIMALGFGWKSAGGTEVLVQGGGVALWAFLVGTAEVDVAHDIFRRAWGAVHVGAAGSLLHDHAFVIDCYEGESCEDFVQTLWLGSPRVGLRLRLDRRKQYGALPHLDLAVGPQIGTCRGDCPGGELVVNAAVNLRGVLDFGPRRPR